MKDNRISIRPVLNLSADKENESFQNLTLRPILKLQHDIILRLFINSIKKQKLQETIENKEVFFQFIETSIVKNISLRNLLIGLVLGQFTISEFDEYKKNGSEYNKRIINMIKQRLYDSFGEFKDLIEEISRKD
ncbi:glyoxalase [Tenacibaculum xiamenense]|uniref:glyoxalase n=1 Tax=Tenacibaculum xiamenense TaxID=1261553 RepID=UPI00389662FA